MTFTVYSRTWGELEANTVKVEGLLLRLTHVTRQGKLFHAECLIPIGDVSLIVPPTV